MSLTGKQIRELNSAYKSVYAKPEPIEENLAITKEEFEELCISILVEAFEGNGIEVYDQTDLTPRQIQEAPSANPKDIAKNLIKTGIKKTIKTVISPKTLLGIGIGADATTGGNVSRTGLAVANNALPFIRNMYTAVKNNMKYKGTVLQNQDGKYTTADQVRKKDNKNESVEFSLHIVEDDSIKDLIDKKNKNDKKKNDKNDNVINKDNKDKKDNKKSTDGTAIGNIGFQGTEAEFDKKYNIPPKDDKTTTPPKDDKTTTPPKDDKTTTPPKDDKTTTPPKDDKTTVTPPNDNKKNEVKKDRLPDFGPPKEVTIKDFQPVDTKPKNPSGKVIPKPKRPMRTNSPAAKAGIPLETRQKKYDMNAAFQATKKKDSGYTKMDFIKDFPNSQTAKKYRKGEPIPGFKYKKNLKNSYEPYHIVLGYLLSEGHADTINEAHYVMTQMDDQTVQEIVALDEGPIATAGAVAGALTLGGMGLNAIKKQLDNKKKMEKGGTFKQGSMMDNIQKKKNMLKNLENY